MQGLRGQFGQFSGLGAGTGFPNPFCDIASLAVPANLRSALYWAEYIFSVNGTYRMALERTISYFLTEVEILNASDDEAQKWRNFLDNTIDVISVTQDGLRNRACYGNDFSSILTPFKRFLSCPKCGYMAPLSEVYSNKHAFDFAWEIPKFVATCPACKVGSGYRGPWRVKDEDDDLERKIRVKRWNPHEIELLHDTYTDDVAYLWRIPEDYKQQVRKGDLYHLERVTMPVLEAIATNRMFRFANDAIFHMKEPTLAGILNRGWGLPRILTNFRQIWYVQVLRRFNEAIALDYVIPFRVITPAPASGKTGGGLPIDPLLTYDGNDFRGIVRAMERRRRYDPAALQTLPFPVNFQMFGADAAQLAPRELLDQAQETLLHETGVPVELYNGTLTFQAATPALRLFESTWHHLVHDSNAMLRWLVRQIGQILSWEEIEARLKRVTIADDLERHQMAAQLMMSQQLSGTTVFRDLGYGDWKQEQKQIGEESRYQAELQARLQEEMQQAGFAQQVAKGQGVASPAGGAPQGGAPGGAPPAGGDQSQQGGMPAPPVSQYLASMSPNVPQSPEDMLSIADSLANELLGYPETVKDSELRKLKQSNEALHSLVKAKMADKRQQARSQAGQAAAMQGQAA